MKRHLSGAVAVTAALAAPSAAAAHVSVHPNAVPAGANATLDIRVPNETDNATRVKITHDKGKASFSCNSARYREGFSPELASIAM